MRTSSANQCKNRQKKSTAHRILKDANEQLCQQRLATRLRAAGTRSSQGPSVAYQHAHMACGRTRKRRPAWLRATSTPTKPRRFFLLFDWFPQAHADMYTRASSTCTKYQASASHARVTNKARPSTTRCCTWIEATKPHVSRIAQII
jgi:hypothetical protein